MISIEGLTVEFSAKPLFRDVSFVINDHDRIALVGKNGAGKSTMLKILCGEQQPTSGVVSIPGGTTIGYLPQVMRLADDTTVREEARKAFSDNTKMQQQLERMQQEMADRTDFESEGYAQLVERFTHLHDRYMLLGGENYEAEIDRTLQGLGFSRADFCRPTREFSGGWRMRVELAKILLRKPDVLLLDEPTNHLDIESIQWLEQFIQQSAKAVVLVSHDRAFINNVTTRTLEITCGHVEDYKVRYDEYVVLRKERREQQMRAYENQQKEIADTRAFIERFRYQATKAVQVQQRIRQLEKIVPIEIDEVDNRRMHLKFPPCLRSGDYPVICQGVEKAYGDHVVFSDVDLTIKRGEKVAFVGRNGEGKSTLVKCIMNEIPYGGTLKIGHNVQIGYFAQNQAQLLDERLTVFETIDEVARGEMRLKINDLLGAFMFGGEASEKPVSVLSGGERSRLAMIRLLLEPVNLLILDEPTNHLDTPRTCSRRPSAPLTARPSSSATTASFSTASSRKSMSLAAATCASISAASTTGCTPAVPPPSTRPWGWPKLPREAAPRLQRLRNRRRASRATWSTRRSRRSCARRARPWRSVSARSPASKRASRSSTSSFSIPPRLPTWGS